MDKVARFIDVMNAFKLCAALAVVDLIAAGAYKIKEVWSAKRHNTNVLDADTDTRIYVPSRVRNRRSDNRCNTPLGAEEKAIVLKAILCDFDKMLTPYEKEVLEAIAEERQDETDEEEDIDVDGALQRLNQAVERFGETLRTWRGFK